MTAPTKPLKLWNGRYMLHGRQVWLCVAAYSAADASRLLPELGLYDPGASEIRNYWSPCWGNDMRNITPERGVWVKDNHSQDAPKRYLP